MSKIGLFFGSDTGNTEVIARKLAERLTGAEIDLYNIAEAGPDDMDRYEKLILGIPTWDFGGIQEDWENFWPSLEAVNFSCKTVALFGLGDQFGFGDYFLDAMGLLYDIVVAQGAAVVGFWSTEGYEFEESKALTPDRSHFVGLAIDEDQQFNLTEQRLDAWSQQLIQEFDL